ncbi:CHAP domain-containing protein [Sinomonas sp. G460-2]|uniref:CHAP domain-containing protein n=1 Tax=Sinomonas sp. G460-2 TaxID=3393464 RepID=UPI0039EEECA7
MGSRTALGAAAAALLVGAVALVTVVTDGNGSGTPLAAQAACVPAPAGSPAVTTASRQIAGYSGVQLANARAIIDAGKAMGLSVRGETIGVMTAMGESGLRVLDHGDTVGRDSRGLFQQRGNGAWGSPRDRMDPGVSAANFFRALLSVQGWERLDPTIAAHRVQRNADPYHYEGYWPDATAMVSALAGVKGSDIAGSCARAAGAGDDLPWAAGPIDAASPNGTFTRECVDFALWRLNQALGSTRAPFKILNSNFRPDGRLLGSALTWKDGWDARGWPTGKTPQAGAVAWYAPNTGGAGGLGHVAIVTAVHGDGTYLEEGYNGNPPPNDHTYYTRTVKDSAPSAFLYVPTRKDLGLAS